MTMHEYKAELEHLKSLVRSAIVDIEECRGCASFFGPFDTRLDFQEGGQSEVFWPNLAIHTEKLKEAIQFED